MRKALTTSGLLMRIVLMCCQQLVVRAGRLPHAPVNRAKKEKGYKSGRKD